MERILCTECGKSVSTPVPVDTIVRAYIKCPECIEAQDIPQERLIADLQRQLGEAKKMYENSQNTVSDLTRRHEDDDKELTEARQREEEDRAAMGCLKIIADLARALVRSATTFNRDALKLALSTEPQHASAIARATEEKK